MRELVKNMIASKEKELKRMQEGFIIDTKYIDSATYENNAINTLLAMKKLKTEIQTLTEQLLYVEMYCKEEL